MRRILASLVLPLLLSPRIVVAQCAGAAQEAFQERRWDDARAAAQAQLTESPGHAATLYCIGRIAYANGKSGEAVDWFEKAIKVEANSALYHLWLGNALGDEAQRANKLRQPFLARRVKSEFERAVALDPSSIDARKGLIGFYSIAPGIMGGSMERAKAEAAEIGKLNAMRGHLEMGLLFEREKKLAAAESAFKAAVDASPDSLAGYYGIGAFYQRHTRWDDAFAVYERLIQLKPAEAVAHYQYGRTAALSGKNLERGERELQSLLDEPPKDFSPLSVAAVSLRLGNIYEKQGKTDLARSAYEQALKLNPKNEDARKALAAIKP
jgi:tetratricopeptide (TPR) repeat protein